MEQTGCEDSLPTVPVLWSNPASGPPIPTSWAGLPTWTTSGVPEPEFARIITDTGHWAVDDTRAWVPALIEEPSHPFENAAGWGVLAGGSGWVCPAPAAGLILAAEHAEIYVGWSRHWTVSWLWFLS